MRVVAIPTNIAFVEITVLLILEHVARLMAVEAKLLP
jgi:hypothetical protein